MMRQKGIKLSVSEPCHEKWSEMNQSEKGRFCMSCQKEVVDFTTYSDEQILNYFSSASGKQCGRFYNSQLERKIVPVRTVKRPSVWQLAFGSVFAFLSSKMAVAQHAPKTETVQTEPEKTHPISPSDMLVDDSFVLEGAVVDSTTDEALIGASVVIEHTTIGTTTDIDGRFRLAIPKQRTGDSRKIVVSYVGYTKRVYALDGKQTQYTFKLIADTSPNDVVVVVGGVSHATAIEALSVTPGPVIVESVDYNRLEKLRVKTWLKSIGHW